VSVSSCRSVAKQPDPSEANHSTHKVYMKATYEPVVKASGKSVGPQCDLQEWTVKDGKIARAHFFWGNTKALEEMFA